MITMHISKIHLAAALAVFAQYADAQEVYVTDDGNVWLPGAKHLAYTHAKANKLPAPTRVERKHADVVDGLRQLLKGTDKAAADKAAADKAAADKAAADKAAADKAAADKAAADKAAADKAAANKAGKKGK
ncbi:MAG: hypothetical protein KIT10_14575 [Flavobacteriales bacterium]|nr:hypothetical protein [Flavobacteriales bacterium]